VSVGPGGVQANWYSNFPAISADGRFVSFWSKASNLVAGDTNFYSDIFVRNRQTGTTQRVSIGPGGRQSNGDVGEESSISADGRFIAFASQATHLVPGDTNNTADVFVRDRQTGTTERVSVGPGGVQANAGCRSLAISPDGRYVVFYTYASNLVKGDTNGWYDVFLRDRKYGITRRVSVGPDGSQGNKDSGYAAISADGRFVAFSSFASNLVSADTNNQIDIFVRDRQTHATERVNVGPGGVQANGDSSLLEPPAISANGRFVAFSSAAGNLVPGDTNDEVDIFVSDRQTGTTRRVSVGSGAVQANGFSYMPAMSADGRFVTFASTASNLVPGDTNDASDVFVRDRQTGTTRRLSVGPGAAQANSSSERPAISADGRFVAFPSYATNLVPGDTNEDEDMFVRRWVP
jgi:Tol biopolymer transport system component